MTKYERFLVIFCVAAGLLGLAVAFAGCTNEAAPVSASAPPTHGAMVRIAAGTNSVDVFAMQIECGVLVAVTASGTASDTGGIIFLPGYIIAVENGVYALKTATPKDKP